MFSFLGFALYPDLVSRDGTSSFDMSQEGAVHG
jgi:hypothetical protein